MKQIKKSVSVVLTLAMLATFVTVVEADVHAALVVQLATLSSEIKAGENTELDVTITSEQNIDKAEFYVNGTFYAVKYNCNNEFKYYYPVPVDTPAGEINFEVIVYDSLGVSSKSNKVDVRTTDNSPTEIKFIDLPTLIDIDSFSEVNVRITDSDGISDIKLYVNGRLSHASYAVVGDTYTFTGFEKNIGEMKFDVKVTDNTGVINSAEAMIALESHYMKNLFTNEMTSTYNPGGNFKLSEEGYSFALEGDSTNKYLQVTRTRATTSAKNPYLRYQVNGKEGVFELGFDIKFSEGYENAGLYVDLRGASAEPVTPRTTGSSITFKNGTADEVVNGVFSAGEWYKCKYVCDTSLGTYSLFVNDTEYVAANGEKFKLPIGTASSTGSVMYIAIYLVMPDENDTIAIDNLYFNHDTTIGKVDSVAYADGIISVAVAGSLNEGSLSGKVALRSKDEEIEVLKTVYDSDNGSILITPAKELMSAVKYTLILKAGAQTEDGMTMPLDAIKDFKTESKSFDITDVDFNEYSEAIGVSATVSNTSDESKTLLMIMTLKDENGAVQSVTSSALIYLNPGARDVEVTIAPMYAKGLTAEVFFLNNWEESVAVKHYIYEQ